MYLDAARIQRQSYARARGGYRLRRHAPQATRTRRNLQAASPRQGRAPAEGQGDRRAALRGSRDAAEPSGARDAAPLEGARSLSWKLGAEADRGRARWQIRLVHIAIILLQPVGRCAKLDDTRGGPSLCLRIRRMCCTKCGTDN